MYSFIETKLFSRLVADVLTDEEYSSLQNALIKDPEAGDYSRLRWYPQITLGCGRSRQARWYSNGSTTPAFAEDKYGCLHFTRRTWWKISPPTYFAKLRKRLMAKAKRNLGLEILEGIREIKRGEHGRVINIPAVSAVRESTGLSQSQFAELLGVSVRTLQDWEQGRRAPSGAARTLLRIVAKNPRVLREVA